MSEANREVRLKGRGCLLKTSVPSSRIEAATEEPHSFECPLAMHEVEA
jgi:hypothetical protein